VVCLDDPQQASQWNDPFPVHALGKGKTAWQYHGALHAWLVEHLPAYEVVISHGLWQYQNLAVARAIQTLKKRGLKQLPKMYVMAHGMLDPWFQQHSSRRLKAWRNKWYWQLLQEKIIRQADGILFTCEEELLLARQAFHPYRPQREWNVGYGVPVPPPHTANQQQAFHQACASLPSHQPYLLFLSRIHPKKGVDLLLSAYALGLASSGKEQSWPHLVIAGPGIDTAYGRQLIKMTQENVALHGKVHFPGMLTGLAKWGALYGCEAFVLPSHQENFGIAVVEALACRKPVLISRQVNIYKEIERAGAGIIETDDQEGTLRLLRRWACLATNEREAMASAASYVYAAHFSVQAAATQMLDVLMTMK
jgi:glycosyltransferase involved in cell wall biosynthesis